MRQLKIENIDTGIEKLIICGLIMNKEFLAKMSPIIKQEYFKGDITGNIAEWCVEYLMDANDAPKNMILNLVKIKTRDLDNSEESLDFIENVNRFLKEELSSFNPNAFNADYIYTKGMAYLEVNSIEYRSERIQRALNRGDTKEALKLMRNASLELFQEMRRPKDFPNVNSIITAMTKSQDNIMTLPGALGRYMPKMQRGRLIAFLGPTKRGKSRWLFEMAFHAMMSGLKVIYISLELHDWEVELMAVARYLGREVDIEEELMRLYQIPVFDCKKNIYGTCSKDIRTNDENEAIIDDIGAVLPFEECPHHMPCTVCRNRNDDHRKDFEPASWFIEDEKDTVKLSEVKKLSESICRSRTGGSLKIQAYPIGTATFEDIEDVLDKEELFDNWIPDVIIVDSADNFKKDKKMGERRHQLSDIWEQLSKLTKNRNTLTFTATQGNRASNSKDRLTLEDISEDWTKAQVVDALVAINERGYENTNPRNKDKYWGRQQLEILATRYGKIIPNLQCMTINHFGIGQTCLDSEIVYYKKING